MLYRQEFDCSIKCYVNHFTEIFPIEVSDIDFGIILDSGLERCDWIKEICWNPMGEDNPMDYFLRGGTLFIKDENGKQLQLTKNRLIKGIKKVLEENKYFILVLNRQLYTHCFSEELCADLIKKSLYD